jgi:hypothetical protein
VRRDDARVLEAPQQAHEPAPRARVEARRRLVHDQDVGLHGEHRGDGHRALLAAGEVVGRALRQVLSPDARERGGDAGRDVGGREPEVERPEPHVLGHRRQEQLVVRVLEHHADGATDVGQRPLGDRDAADVDAAAGGCEQPVEVQEEGRLAGAVGADEGDGLAVADLERDAVQRLRPVRIGEAQVADADGVVAHARPPLTRTAR